MGSISSYPSACDNIDNIDKIEQFDLLYDDILTELFLRLDNISIIMSLYVCKKWNNLIKTNETNEINNMEIIPKNCFMTSVAKEGYLYLFRVNLHKNIEILYSRTNVFMCIFGGYKIYQFSDTKTSI